MEHRTTIIDLRGSGTSSSEAGFGVLADPSGRRRRGLRRAGRAIAVVFALWLCALALAGLGLLPGVGIPLASRSADSAPPPLDDRSPLVAAKGTRPALAHAPQVSRSAVAMRIPLTARPSGLERPRAVARKRPAARERTRTMRPVPAATAPGASRPASPQATTTPAPRRPATPPGRAVAVPGNSGTAPGQIRPAKTPAPTAAPTPVHGKPNTAPGRSGH
jgi:hypothetical protein